ncbi:MAG: hypothetical protein AAB520_01705, partial [Patescibacteria group bacterium]
MEITIKEKVINFFSSFKKNLPILSAIILFVLAIMDYLFKWNIVTPIFNSAISLLNKLLKTIQDDFAEVPFLFSIAVFFALTLLWLLWRYKRQLNIVAGEFKDDFKNGLFKWDYGGEGWKIEYENNSPVLSVTDSQDVCISKRGFIWADYEFSFEAKVIKDASGGIIRAENRSKFFMIQLNMQNP